MVLHNIVFVSEATVALHEHDLLLMLRQTCAEQQANQVTGLLLYLEGHFLQLLEGPEKPLREYFNRVAGHPYQSNLQKLADGPVGQRDFAHWYVCLGHNQPAPPLPHYVALPELQALITRPLMQHLLQEFLDENCTPPRRNPDSFANQR